MSPAAPPVDQPTSQPYFSIPAIGWGTGWKAGPRYEDKLSGLPQQSRAVEVSSGSMEYEDAVARARDRVAAEVGRHRDEELKAALTRALGDGWSPEALAGRTAHIAASDTYLLDGRPLVSFARLRFSQVGQHLQWSVDVERFNWRPET